MTKTAPASAALRRSAWRLEEMPWNGGLPQLDGYGKSHRNFDDLDIFGLMSRVFILFEESTYDSRFSNIHLFRNDS